MEVVALVAGVGAAIVEIDEPGVGRIGRINVARPEPIAIGIGEVIAVDGRAVNAVVHDGEQLAAGGDAPGVATRTAQAGGVGIASVSGGSGKVVG